MARLKDLVNVDLNTDFILVQDTQLPINFGMDAMEYIADIYGEDYSVFEKDLNEEFTGKESIKATRKNMKIIRALIYGMVRSGGTECSPKELQNSIPFSQVSNIYQICLDVFMSQNFEEQDLKKSVKPQDFQKKKTNKNRKR
ncbi:hypothetical protein [Vagococcus salmoninarum]|uniref:hypothetical protein n=1 Tax=Vagococcus salmoninarum TaxID=2739 RepID=UPI001881AF17|nr:hypothetical protein [Vagococcus salmoninarum]MBE9390332.1 hypothetical protein [Vagococcus salmoninarum]